MSGFSLNICCCVLKMKNKLIWLLPITLLAITSCSSEKQINHDSATKRASAFNVESLNGYNENVDVSTTYEHEESGAYLEDGDLYKTLPSFEDVNETQLASAYFYSQQKIKDLSLKTTTSNGVEKSTKIYTYLKTGLKILIYEKIKTKSNGLSYNGFEQTTTYILDDGRVEKILSERKISTDGDMDDFKLTGQYHYKCTKNITWNPKAN